MFLDASAIVAIIALEMGHEELAARLDAVAQSRTSPLAVFEAAMLYNGDDFALTDLA